MNTEDSKKSSINHSEREKRLLERQAAKLFLQCYGQLTGQRHGSIVHNDPLQPDISTSLAGTSLDLEIAHLYGSAAEAMLLLGKELSDDTYQALRSLEQTDPDHRLLQALQRILHAKAGKLYQSKRVWLVLRNANPLWQRQDFLDHLPLLQLPEQHPFEQIWVVADMHGISGLVALYP